MDGRDAIRDLESEGCCGIGFFDVDHGTEQDGKAPNNLELHPVIGMS